MTQSTIVLCGFMGCGKSTIGRLLAKRLSRTFIDLDAFIEERAGKRIPAIFEQQGEAAFRALETACLTELAARPGVVLATGGGALLRPENAAAAHAGGGRVVFLNCPFALCYRRIRNSDRPIVRRSTVEELKALYHTRLPLYRAACDVEIACGGPTEQVLQRVLSALQA